jgi:galactokinase/mevalonate kinase-like predicted kinase
MLLARAPVRISLAGGGTDLPAYYERFGGMVVSVAINKYFYVFLTPSAGDDVQSPRPLQRLLALVTESRLGTALRLPHAVLRVTGGSIFRIGSRGPPASAPSL